MSNGGMRSSCSAAAAGNAGAGGESRDRGTPVRGASATGAPISLAHDDGPDHAVGLVAREMADVAPRDLLAERDRRLPRREGGDRDLRGTTIVARLGARPMPLMDPVVAHDPFVVDRVVVANDEGDRPPGGDNDRRRIEARVVDPYLDPGQVRCLGHAGSEPDAHGNDGREAGQDRPAAPERSGHQAGRAGGTVLRATSASDTHAPKTISATATATQTGLRPSGSGHASGPSPAATRDGEP